MSLSYTGQKGTRALIVRMERTIRYMDRWAENHGARLTGNAGILYVGGTLYAAERWLKRDPAKNHTPNNSLSLGAPAAERRSAPGVCSVSDSRKES